MFSSANFWKFTHIVYFNLRSYCTLSVRVRFAPSPTGYMHVGGLRTALINKIFAVQNDGKFVLRIEDTDQTRFQPDALEDILTSLEWAGLHPDESPVAGGNFGPYIQSKRRSIYQNIVDHLIKKGFAYRCFCSPERLRILRNEQERRGEDHRYDNRCRELSEKKIQNYLATSVPYTVRLKVPNSIISIEDIIFGKTNFNLSLAEGDFIIMKSDGMPVYHLANVIDDHYMEISHVIRGAEWLASTPKHILLYQIMEWKPPQFAHIPLLLASSGGKLSKRSPEFSLLGQVRSLRRAGYLPSAILTWLSSTGSCEGTKSNNHIDNLSNSTSDFIRWKPELEFSDLVSRFRLDKMSRQNAHLSPDMLRMCGRVHFDRAIEKAKEWYNKHNLNQSDQVPEIIKAVRVYLESQFLNANEYTSNIPKDNCKLVDQLYLLQGRIHCLSDLIESHQGYKYLWISPNPQICAKQIQIKYSELINSVDKLLSYLIENLAKLSSESLFQSADLNNNLTDCLKRSSKLANIDQKITMRIIRFGLIGLEVGSPVINIIEILSIDETVRRLRALRECLDSSSVQFSNL